jgi:hypothetical protein
MNEGKGDGKADCLDGDGKADCVEGDKADTWFFEQLEDRSIGAECGDTFLCDLPSDIAATVRTLGSAALTSALKVSSCDYSPGGGNHGVTPW